MLAAQLKRTIQIQGPISLSHYMQSALLHPTLGYYTSKKTVFGLQGDFTTSPEISQCFGECLGVWFLNHYHRLALNLTLVEKKHDASANTHKEYTSRTIQETKDEIAENKLQQKRAKTVSQTTDQQSLNTKNQNLNANGQQEKKLVLNIIEIGPGKGTLMLDFLRTIFQLLKGSLGEVIEIKEIHLVEPSRILRALQRDALESANISRIPTRLKFAEQILIESGTTHGSLGGINIKWHDDFESVPETTNFVLTHELFDALPIHKFEVYLIFKMR